MYTHTSKPPVDELSELLAAALGMPHPTHKLIPDSDEDASDHDEDFELKSLPARKPH